MRSGVRSICLQAPCGAGKTLLTAHMLKTASEKGMRSWFLNHRRELITQGSRAFAAIDLPHGIIAAGFQPEPNKNVQIASVQTLIRRPGLNKPKLVVWDEVHHLGAKSWAALHATMPDAFHIGLSATPVRTGTGGLGKWFTHMVRGPSVSALIEQGYLSKYKLYAPVTADLSGLRTRMGDYIPSELSERIDRPSLVGDAVIHYKRYVDGKRALVFAVSIKHSQHVVAQFNSAGIPAEHVDGECSMEYRDAAMKRFQNGETLVISNVSLFGEGLDIPGIEAVILLRPTRSVGLYIQQSGRALRPSPGKETAIILDHSNNCRTHGLPDEDREWTLEGNHKRDGASQEEGPSVRICEKCFAATKRGPPNCLYCGTEFAVEPRKLTQKDGDLEEITKQTAKREAKAAQGQARTLEELVALGVSRGYKSPLKWGMAIIRARKERFK